MAPAISAPGMPDHWGWPNFSPDELRCKHTGTLFVVPTFMDRLQRLRTALGFVCPLTSYYRHPTHPAERGKPADRPGAHTLGRAADIRVYGIRALIIVERAREFGFTGIGVSQDSGTPLDMRFVHLDDLAADEFHAPRPAFWSY